MAEDRPAALVTGSASGIGRAAALRLARAGYDVAINYRRSEDDARRTLAELESLGGRPWPCAATSATTPQWPRWWRRPATPTAA